MAGTYTRTEEHRKKVGEVISDYFSDPKNRKNHTKGKLFKKGFTPWNKGKPHLQGKNHPMWGKHPVAWNKGKTGLQVAWNKKERIENKCKNCNQIYLSLKSAKKKYCSNKCYWIDLSTWPKETTSNWKGGISKDWVKNHRELMRFYCNKRRAIQRGNGGSFTKQEWDSLKKIHNYSCVMCKKSEPEIKLTIDHILPVTKGGNSYISNIQPLCLSCNSKKSNRLTLQYLSATVKENVVSEQEPAT